MNIRFLTALALALPLAVHAATTPLYVGRYFGSFISITNAASANGEQYGNGATASGNFSTAVGVNATASASQTIAVGRMALANAQNGVSLGENAQATGQNSTALGGETTASAVSASAIGYNALANALSSTAIGTTATVGINGVGSIAVGVGATANHSGETIVGNGASSASPNATILGNAGVAVTGGTALGSAATAGFTNSTAVGINASTTRTNQVRLGDNSQNEVSIPGHMTLTGRQTNSTLTASVLTGTDPNKALTSVAVGSGLSLSGGTLSATGGSGGIYPTNDFIQIPAASGYVDNIGDGLTITAATATSITNYAPGFAFLDVVTNAERFVWVPPTNWDAGSFKLTIETVSTSTNNGAQGQTNVFFAVRAAALSTFDQVSAPTWGNFTVMTNLTTTNSWIKYRGRTAAITAGHGNSNPTNSVIIEVQRWGSHANDTYTNILGIAIANYGIDYLILPQNTLPLSTP